MDNNAHIDNTYDSNIMDDPLNDFEKEIREIFQTSMDFDNSMEQADDNPKQMNLSINKQQDHQLIKDRHNKKQRDDNLEQKQQHQRQINKED